MADKQYTVGIPQGLLCAIERVAAQTGMPMSTVISVAIREFVKLDSANVLVHEFWASGGWKATQDIPQKRGFLGRVITALGGSG